LVCDEVGHRLGGFEPCSSCAWAAGRGRLANQAARAQISQRVDLIDGNQARHATSTHRHDDLGAVLDVLHVAAEAVVQLANADLGFQRFGMWRHNDRLYALHRRLSRISRTVLRPRQSESPHDGVADAPYSSEAVAPELARTRLLASGNAVDERAQSRGRVRLAAMAAALAEPAATEPRNQL
jgi:hypothetical protein